MDITTEIGKRIRYYRTKKNISQEKLSEYSDLHPTYIGQLERGEKTPTIETLYKITCGLNISLSSFLEGIEQCEENPDDYYAYKSFQLIELQTPENQKQLYYIIEHILKLNL